MTGTKIPDISTRFLELYYQRLLSTPAVQNKAPRKEGSGMVGMSTIRDIHKLLRSCFEQAVKWEIMEKNPAIHATVPRYKAKKREIWTADILMKATELCGDGELKLAMNLAFSGSLRIGELAGLTWDCVDITPEAVEKNRASIYINKEFQRVSKEAVSQLGGKDIILAFPSESPHCTTVRVLKAPKTESSIRRVYLPRSVANMLQGWKEEQEKTKEFAGEEYHDYNLVMATWSGMPIGISVIEKRFAKLIRENGLPEVVFHSLRHSSITYKLKLNGGDIKSVQGDSGHSQSKMVSDVYSHIIDEDRRRNAEAFEEAFYGKKNLSPSLSGSAVIPTGAVPGAVAIPGTVPLPGAAPMPDGIDPALLAKVLSNPEMLALISALAKRIQE